MKFKQIVVGIAMTFLLFNIVIADNSSSFNIDMSTFNGGGTLSSSSTFQVNDTILGFVSESQSTSTSFGLDSGLVNLELYCGNDILELGEQCDDGNRISGDGCSSLCISEVVVVPPPEPPPELPPPPPDRGGGYKTPLCGNGLRNGSEQCDDGNNINGDGCDSICRVEPFVFPICGNGIIQAGEECDDGNTIDGDGCSAQCVFEVPVEELPICGNGIVEIMEQCDDGNLIDGDGCTAFCAIEPPPKVEVPVITRQIKVKARPEKRVNASQNWGVESVITFYNKDTREFAVSTPITINNIGWGAMESTKLPDGNYDIALKGLSHLTKVLRNVKLDSETETLDFTLNETFFLFAGDVHRSKDNFVNGLDISATARQLYGSDIHADLNRDGIINSLDISIAIHNLYKWGERL